MSDTHLFELRTATATPAGSIRAGSELEAIWRRNGDLWQALRVRYVRPATRERHYQANKAVRAEHSEQCACRGEPVGTVADLY